MLLNCWRRLFRVPCTARRSNQSILKEINPDIHWKDWCWSWNSNTLATWFKELIHWKRPWCWERLIQEEKGMTEDEMVGWYHWHDGHEFWVGFRSWWWTGKPGVLQSMGSQRVGHNLETELNWTYFLHSNSQQPFKFTYLFIYFCLCWVFIGVWAFLYLWRAGTTL